MRLRRAVERMAMHDEMPQPAFLRLERIANGILVHFDVPHRQTHKMPGGLGAPAEEFVDWNVKTKTLFCKDLKEVKLALDEAWKAQQWIEKLDHGAADADYSAAP